MAALLDRLTHYAPSVWLEIGSPLGMATGYDYRKYQKVKANERRQAYAAIPFISRIPQFVEQIFVCD